MLDGSLKELSLSDRLAGRCSTNMKVYVDNVFEVIENYICTKKVE